jgi:hypothetical protein
VLLTSKARLIKILMEIKVIWTRNTEKIHTVSATLHHPSLSKDECFWTGFY